MIIIDNRLDIGIWLCCCLSCGDGTTTVVEGKLLDFGSQIGPVEVVQVVVATISSTLLVKLAAFDNQAWSGGSPFATWVVLRVSSCGLSPLLGLLGGGAH